MLLFLYTKPSQIIGSKLKKNGAIIEKAINKNNYLLNGAIYVFKYNFLKIHRQINTIKKLMVI